MNEHFTTLISANEAHVLHQQPNVVFLDCTYYLADFDQGRKEYMQHHIPGAFFLDILHDLSGPLLPGVNGRHPLPDPELMAHTFSCCGIDQDAQVITYDQANGAYASRAWWLLNWLGHENVAVMDGGYRAWQDAGYASDNQWQASRMGNFKAKIRPELTIDKERLASGYPLVVDSREKKRYTGETEPIDPIAGHIPGAICLPYLDNIDETGKWKSKSYYEEKFSGVDNETTPVFYCGSGVTACHNILAYKIATGRDAKLYGGSWSEWINYYPVAVGESA